MRPLRDRVFFITGASAGIGRELALQLARQGAHLILGARNTRSLEEVKARIEREHRAMVLTSFCDVTEEKSLEACVAQGLEKFGRIDAVVANAGFGVYGRFDECSLADYEKQFQTNTFGVLRTIYAVLDPIRRSRGQIVIIGSVGGYIGRPGLSAYSMSKFALRGLAQSLDAELRPQGVAVSLISPGMVVSDVRKNAVLGTHVDPDLKFPEAQFLRVGTGQAAEDILKAIEREKPEAIITGHGKVIVGLMRFLPRLTLRLLARSHVNGR